MDAQWVLVMCVIALSIGLYRMSRRIDQKIDQAIAQSTSNPLKRLGTDDGGRSSIRRAFNFSG